MTLSEALNKLRRKRALAYWGTAAIKLVAGNLCIVLLLFVLDNMAAFSKSARIFLLCAIAAGNLCYLVYLLWNARKLRRSQRENALELEAINGIRDNALVNAVCFHDEGTLPPHLAAFFTQNADQRCKKVYIPGIRQAPQFRRAILALCCVALVSLLYAGIFFRYAQNAYQRFRHPTAKTASLNFASFDVLPGNCRVPKGNPLTIKARAFYNGRELSDLKLLIENTAPPVMYHLDNGSFKFKAVTGDIAYSIRSGREHSETYTIKAVEPPQLGSLSITINPPEYTGLKGETLSPGDNFRHSVPEGSKVKVKCNGLEALLYANGKNAPLEKELIVESDLALRLAVKDKDGLQFDNAWQGELKCHKDAPPEVRFQNPKTNVEAGYGETLPIRLFAGDDYGIAGIQLFAETEGKSIPIKKYEYPLPGSQKRNEVFLLRLSPALLPENGSIELRATTKDSKGQESISATTFTIHHLNLLTSLKEELATGDAAKCYELLFAALQEQTASRDRIALQLKKFPNHQAYRLYNEQQKIASRIKKAGNEAAKAKLPRQFQKALSIVSNDATALQNEVAEMRKAPDSVKLNNIVLHQTALIDKLQKLLGMLALRQRNAENKKELTKELEAEKELFDQLKKLKDKLGQFKEEQRKILSDTEAIDPKKTDDWTEKEEELLGDLSTKEQDWAQLFRAAFSDLTKCQNQDFSNSAMSDELSELYEELQKAGEALKAKKIEIATLAENTALIGAENVEVNLERWLSDKQDYIKWNSEEDGNSQDIKLTDLPAELMDIIGDLIEQEEDMGEDTQDGTNSFAYDSDDGLGWGVSDGTIDSMQAKGITGNVMPNNNEVGGRSGEGRSGKSTGQFVEKEATGKGGRKTPTRLVQSPFEKGTVLDKSNDPQGGATGGGKQSGVGDEGLTGVTPDQDQRTGQRMEGKQAELKQRTIAMLKRLDDADLPTGDLREALEKMRALERLGDGGGPEARRLKGQLAQSLSRARAAVQVAMKAERESILKRKKDSFPVKYRHNEKVPPAFEEYVGEYFKAIAIEEAAE